MHTSHEAPDTGHEAPGTGHEAPAIADGVHRRLDPRIMQLERITGLIATAVVSVFVAVGVLIAWLASDSSIDRGLATLAWPLVTAVLAWHAYRWPAISYRHESYRVDAQGIEIRRGVVWCREITVPKTRVQHIDVSQGPLERRFGLGSLSIYTAGTDYAMVALRGLPHARALLIRDHLLPRETQDAV